MSQLFDQAVAQVRTLPHDAQDEVARLLLDWAGEMASAVNDRPPEPIDPAHRAAVEQVLTDVRAGRIASDDAVERAFAAFGAKR